MFGVSVLFCVVVRVCDSHGLYSKIDGHNWQSNDAIAKTMMRK
jgi:hypothetical protein